MIYDPTENSMQESNDSLMSENNVEPTVLTVPTNTDTIPIYVLNDSVPSQINKKRLEQILPDINRMYHISMNIEQHILNNESQFNK